MKEVLRVSVLSLCIFFVLNLSYRIPQKLSLGTWKLHEESAGFQIRDSSGELVWKGRAFIIGGYTYGPNLNDIWITKNFSDWALLSSLPCDKDTTHPLVWSKEDRIYISCTNGSLFSTNDFKNWKLERKDSPWAAYWGTCATTFRGQNLVVTGFDFANKSAQIFFSDDLKEWTQKPLKNISVRECHSGFFVFKDQLFLIGGRSHTKRWEGLDDIYQFDEDLSPKLVGKVPWKKRFWETYLSTEEFVIMAGGYHRPDGVSTNFDDVWVTTDGINWIEMKGFKSWRARHEPSLYDYKGYIYLTAGHAYPLQNDVWRISKKKILEYIRDYRKLSWLERELLSAL